MHFFKFTKFRLIPNFQDAVLSSTEYQYVNTLSRVLYLLEEEEEDYKTLIVSIQNLLSTEERNYNKNIQNWAVGIHRQDIL